MDGFNDLFGKLFTRASEASSLAREWQRTADLLERYGHHDDAAKARHAARSLAGAYIRGGAQ